MTIFFEICNALFSAHLEPPLWRSQSSWTQLGHHPRNIRTSRHHVQLRSQSKILLLSPQSPGHSIMKTTWNASHSPKKDAWMNHNKRLLPTPTSPWLVHLGTTENWIDLTFDHTIHPNDQMSHESPLSKRMKCRRKYQQLSDTNPSPFQNKTLSVAAKAPLRKTPPHASERLPPAAAHSGLCATRVPALQSPGLWSSVEAHGKTWGTGRMMAVGVIEEWICGGWISLL